MLEVNCCDFRVTVPSRLKLHFYATSRYSPFKVRNYIFVRLSRFSIILYVPPIAERDTSVRPIEIYFALCMKSEAL